MEYCGILLFVTVYWFASVSAQYRGMVGFDNFAMSEVVLCICVSVSLWFAIFCGAEYHSILRFTGVYLFALVSTT